MIYQVFYDQRSMQMVENSHECIIPCGVNDAQKFGKFHGAIYDNEKQPNLAEHNTLCEWRVLYYIWKNHPSNWVGFTSWQHNRKGFTPQTDKINESWVHAALEKSPIRGFISRSVKDVAIEGIDMHSGMTLMNQFLQWSQVESIINKKVYDTRKKAMGRFHTEPYWDFVINTYQRFYGPDLSRELDWNALGEVEKLHTWCNAFVAKWEYFDDYMKTFSPIVLSMLSYFGSHPVELELSYICERMIIIYNYIQYTNHAFN